MDLDIEIAHKATGKSRFEKWLALVIGFAAILAALLATLELYSSKHWEEESTEAADLSVELFGKIAATGPVRSAASGAEQTALALDVEAAERATHPKAKGFEHVRSYVDSRVAARLLDLAEHIGDVPDEATGVDEVAIEVMATDLEGLEEIQAEQNQHVAEAERYGVWISRSVFALSLLALGAILVGLAAVLGVEHGGFLVLSVAVVVLSVAGAWGGSALFV